MTARGLTRAKFVRAAGQFANDTQDWKQRLFGSDGPLARLVRSCIQLLYSRRRGGSQWAFMHKTVQEFSLANAVYGIAMRNEVLSGGGETGWESLSQQSLAESSLSGQWTLRNELSHCRKEPAGQCRGARS